MSSLVIFPSYMNLPNGRIAANKQCGEVYFCAYGIVYIKCQFNKNINIVDAMHSGQSVRDK